MWFDTLRRTQPHICGVLILNCVIFSLKSEETQHNPKLRMFYERTGLYCSTMPMSWNTKTQESSTLKEIQHWMQWLVLDFIFSFCYHGHYWVIGESQLSLKIRWLHCLNANFLTWVIVLWLCKRIPCFREIHAEVFRAGLQFTNKWFRKKLEKDKAKLVKCKHLRNLG